jgi:hypothetical protein
MVDEPDARNSAIDRLRVPEVSIHDLHTVQPFELW